jgi:branched-chain amino acid transport system substrate-binding protein
MRKTAIAAVLMVVLAACGGDGKAAESAREPVLIGMINAEGIGRDTIVNTRRGTEAAIRYFNAERGGIHGRPVELRACTTAGTPEGSAACAHRMVEQKVVAVRGGIDLGSGASLPILKAAGIPYLSGNPLLPPDFTTDGAFTFSPGGAGNAALADFAVTKLGAKKIAILQADDPAGKNLAEAFVKPALLHAGIATRDITMHTEKVTAADLAAVVQAGADDRPDAIVVLFPPPACPRIMQSAHQLRVRVPMLYIEPCGAPEVLRAAGPGADGVYFFGTVLNIQANQRDKDVLLYFEEIDEYGDGVDSTSVETQQGFAATMTVLNRLTTIDGELTPAAIMASFKSAVDAPAFMSHPFTCDGKQALPSFISVCNSHVRIYQFDGGRYRDVGGNWVSAVDPLRR